MIKKNFKGTEMEFFLTGFILICISSDYEKKIKDAVAKKFDMITDPELYTYMNNKNYSLRNNAAFDQLKEILGNFNKKKKDEFHKETDCTHQKDDYNTIISNRNLVAHGRIPNTTFYEVKNMYENSKPILEKFLNILNATYT